MNGSRDLLWRADLTPGAPALETIAGTWTFADLAGLARRGAAHVLGAAPAEDAPIALLLAGNRDFAAWFHAIALAGRTVLPLNLRLTTRELAQQLGAAGANWVLGEPGDARLAELVSELPGLRAEAAPALTTLPTPSGQLPGVSRGRPLAILFTSGTSGRPKGACLRWENFEASAHASEERLGDVVRQRWLACMPLFHVGGLSILMRGVLFGGPIRLQPRFDVGELSAALDAGDVAAVSLVPTMLARLLKHRGPRPAPPGLRVVLLGGAAAAPELIGRALAAGYPVCPTYGLTEATSQVATAAPPRAGARDPEPMLPLAGTEVRIVLEGRETVAGEAGEICVRGPTVMHGYVHDAVASAQALQAGWLHTGDIGYRDERGGLHVLDRRDDLIISGGENVYPAEIEAALLEHPAVEDAGVGSVPDPDLGARVVAWIVPASGAVPDVAALQLHCRSRLAGFKQPREFHIVDALPRNATGKLQRRRLPALTPAT